MDTAKIALQLFTVRERAEKDMRATLKQVAETGFRAVELAGYNDLTPTALRQTLAEYGLQAPTAHVALWFLENQLEQTLEEMSLLGCKYLVVPWLPEEWRTDKARGGEFAELLNRLGGRCQEAGLQLAYHNHAFEFEPLEDSSVWQELTRRTDPALVGLEFDVYWGTYAGLDPVETLNTYQGRIKLLHIKDLAEQDGQRRDVPVGEGQINWPSVLRAGGQTGVDWYIIEQDNPRDAFVDIDTSLKNLKTLMEQV